MDEPTKQQSHWWLKLSGSLNVLLVVLVLGVVGVAAFFGHKMYQSQTEMRETQELVLANMRIMNEQTIVSEILREKLGEKLTTDQIAKLAFIVVDGCRRNEIPTPLVLGLMEQESTYNPKALSNMGAIGLMQVMPDTANKYFKSRGQTMTIEALYDPITNVSIGIDILRDKHETAMILGKTSKEDFVWALYFYCGKGDTYAREVITRSQSYRKRLDAPVKEMVKKAVEEEERTAELPKKTTKVAKK